MAQNSMTNDFYLQIMCIEQPYRSQKTQLTQNMYISKKLFHALLNSSKKYAKSLLYSYESRNRWSLSLWLKSPGPWSSHLYIGAFSIENTNI